MPGCSDSSVVSNDYICRDKYNGGALTRDHDVKVILMRYG